MKPLEIIGVIIIAACIMSLFQFGFAFLVGPEKTRADDITLMNVQCYNVVGVNRKVMTEYVFNVLTKMGTIYEISIKEHKQ